MSVVSVPAASSFAPFDRQALAASIPARFRQQARLHPNRIAVRYGGQSLTYAALDALADRIACAICDRRGPGSEPVALLVDQGPMLVAAILGVLKAGKFYVPLDSRHPPARIRHMLRDAGAALLICDDRNQPAAKFLVENERALLNVERLPMSTSTPAPTVKFGPDDPAYIYFTSGSTGEPKGVVDSHRNVLHNVLRYTDALRIASADRLSMIQSSTFSGCVSSLFGALLNGATLCPFDLRGEGSHKLAEWGRRAEITIWHSTPLLFRELMRDEPFFPSLRIVRLEGDRAQRSDVELFRRCTPPGCLLSNGLGTTETGLVCRYIVGHETPSLDELRRARCPSATLSRMWKC